MVTFLRIHRRLLAFIGASIVAATFIVKEAVRDELKDLTQSIDNARSTTLNRMQQRQVLLYGMTAARTAIKFKMPNAEIRSGIADIVQDVDVRYGQIMWAMGIASDLAKATDQKESLGELNSMAAELVKLDSTNKKIEGITNDAGARKGVLEKAYTEAASNGNLSVAVENKLNHVALRTVFAAERQSAVRHAQYEFYKRLAYWLYGVGWLVGLIGTLLGVEAKVD